MSMYNALFGVNPIAPLLKAVLGLEDQWRTGRFRDIHLNEDGTGIILYTRNGGWNRDHWDITYPNEELGLSCPCPGCCITYHLPKHPNYVRDWDDDFDSTYAYVEFTVPDEWVSLMKELAKGENLPSIGDKFADLVSALDNKESTPETQRALDVGREIFGAIGEAAIGIESEA